MKASITTITLTAILACLAVSAQTQQRPGGAGLAERFKQLDRNGDGKLTRQEVPRNLPFDQWDANKNGVVTLEEIKTFYAGGRNGRAARRRIPPRCRLAAWR
jgi:hypothetical protein